MLTGYDSVSLQNYIAAGSHQIGIKLNSRLPVVSEIQQSGPAAPDHVIINESGHEDLAACPGIGSKTATLIINERRIRPFFDWRDLDDRVKNIGPGKIRTLKEAGVKLNHDG